MANIKAYVRIRPTSTACKHYTWDEQKVYLNLPNQPSLVQRLKREATRNHDFEFTSVFGPTAEQHEVFDVVASNIVKGFLDGYNGTIFAYGQTGSGKTYTIEGTAHRYDDRGLAPRALSLVYKLLEDSNYDQASIHVSYLEIYQEAGYDLLNPTTRPGNVVPHLPKVTVINGPKNSCIIRNLSTHLAADERVAQSLLLQGQANRKVAETPSNQRSSRSHAIFSIYLTAKNRGSDAITRSKLHLVDLAGSERVAKTKIKGKRLGEAKFINLSLHHLESVIIALQQGTSVSVRHRGPRTRYGRYGRQRSQSAGPIRSKIGFGASSRRLLPYARSASLTDLSMPRHIPYRNSLLTMVLKDSLGGNCLTAMIATLSIEDVNIGETLSTCRFAMRVVCIENHASRNETLDDKTIIKRLKQRVRELENEVASLKQGQNKQQNSDSHSTPRQNHNQSSIEERDDVSKVTRYPGSDIIRDSSRHLAKDERSQCVKVMHGFIGGRVNDPLAEGIDDVPKVQECLHLLKKMILQSYAGQRDNRDHQLHHPNADNKTILYPTCSNKSKQNRTRSTPNKHVSDGKSNLRAISTYSNMSVHFGSSRNNASSKISTTEKIMKRVEKKHLDLNEQKKSLAQFQVNLKQQQLEILEYELRLKVSAAQDHVKKQKDVLNKLKRNGADRDEMLMEKEVEKQLLKRLNKYERRLEHVRQQLQAIDNHHQQRKKSGANKSHTSGNVYSRSDVAIETSKVDHSHHRKAKSHVDSKRVMENLKKEEKKQEKVQRKINEERLLAVADHMEMKEASTMQKLREFRAKLEAKNTNDTKPYASVEESHDRQLLSNRSSQSIGFETNPSQHSASGHVIHAWDTNVNHKIIARGEGGDHVTSASQSHGAHDISPVKRDHQSSGNEEASYQTSTPIISEKIHVEIEASDHQPIVTSTPVTHKRNTMNVHQKTVSSDRLEENGYPAEHTDFFQKPEADSESTKAQVNKSLSLVNPYPETDKVSQTSLQTGSLNSRSFESFTSSFSDSHHDSGHHSKHNTSDVRSMFSLDGKSFDSALSSMLQDRSLSMKESPTSSSVWNPSIQSVDSSKLGSMDSYDWRTAAGLTNQVNNTKAPANGSRSAMSAEPKTQAIQLKSKLTDYINLNKPMSSHQKPANIQMPSTRKNTFPAESGDQWSINSTSFCSPSMETLSSNYTTVSAPPDLSNLTDQVNRMKLGVSEQRPSLDQNKDLYSSSKESEDFVSAGATGLMSSQFIESVDYAYRDSIQRKPSAPLGDTESEMSYAQLAKENKLRVAKMRKAMTAAETIQKAWRAYQAKK